MYKLYSNKGLNVIGISTESYVDEWKDILEKEKYPWQNVIDQKGAKIVADVYREYGRAREENTTNILLDSSGKIIAWDPIGLELQWYLEKYLGDDKNK